jgi:hypothetical protein
VSDAILGLVRQVRALKEDNLRLEALVSAKDETIGELLDLIYHEADKAWASFDEWLAS